MNFHNLSESFRVIAIILNLVACLGFAYSAYNQNKDKNIYSKKKNQEMAKLSERLAWSNAILSLMFLALVAASVANYLR